MRKEEPGVGSSRPNGKVLLEVTGLVKVFGGVRAIDHVDFELGRQELRCIIGPNGAGKSTLFKLLTGLLIPDQGRIRLGDHDITRMQTYERARLGLALKYQSFGVYQDLPVEHNLFVALSRRLKRSRELASESKRLLAEMKLENRALAPARTLSHGARQWLEIGMALATEPALLLLDEPTAGMSTEETATTAEIVQQIVTEGVTVLVVEHDMAFVRDLDALVTVMHQGRIFAEGSYAEIEASEAVREIYLGRPGANDSQPERAHSPDRSSNRRLRKRAK